MFSYHCTEGKVSRGCVLLGSLMQQYCCHIWMSAYILVYWDGNIRKVEWEWKCQDGNMGIVVWNKEMEALGWNCIIEYGDGGMGMKKSVLQQ